MFSASWEVGSADNNMSIKLYHLKMYLLTQFKTLLWANLLHTWKYRGVFQLLSVSRLISLSFVLLQQRSSIKSTRLTSSCNLRHWITACKKKKGGKKAYWGLRIWCIMALFFLSAQSTNEICTNKHKLPLTESTEEQMHQTGGGRFNKRRVCIVKQRFWKASFKWYETRRRHLLESVDANCRCSCDMLHLHGGINLTRQLDC